MNARPFFTIATPTFNRARLIPESVQSALQQTEPDFELLISDNASSDNTPQVVRQFQDARLRYFRQPQNLGALGNCQFLLEQAQGEFFVLLQDDDLLHPDFLKRCSQAVIGRPQVAMFAGGIVSGPTPVGVLGLDVKHRDSAMHPVHCLSGRATEIPGQDAAIMQLFGLPFIHPGIALRREFLRAAGGFFSEFSYASDQVTLARVALRGTVMYDPAVVAFFRAHSQSFSAGVGRRDRLAYRRAANEIIIQYLTAADPDWVRRVPACLNCLPKHRKRRLLEEAWEGRYPKLMQEYLLEACAGSSRWKKILLPFKVGVLKFLFRSRPGRPPRDLTPA